VSGKEQRLNRKDLVRELGRRAGLPAADAQRTLDALFGNSADPGLIAAALREGEEVHLQGFGTFDVRARGPRAGRDPRTRTPILIPGRRAPGFRAGSALRGALREPAADAREASGP
jgi:nucleoid DNA-binding protein